jgi:hypothetical protein
MNTIDYLLLAALAGSAIYTFYRLFLGYLCTRSRDLEVVNGTDYSSPSRADSTAADFKR